MRSGGKGNYRQGNTSTPTGHMQFRHLSFNEILKPTASIIVTAQQQPQPQQQNNQNCSWVETK